jgi:hypothetical protein
MSAWRTRRSPKGQARVVQGRVEGARKYRDLEGEVRGAGEGVAEVQLAGAQLGHHLELKRSRAPFGFRALATEPHACKVVVLAPRTPHRP